MMIMRQVLTVLFVFGTVRAMAQSPAARVPPPLNVSGK
jgi:hypothetical protein